MAESFAAGNGSCLGRLVLKRRFERSSGSILEAAYFFDRLEDLEGAGEIVFHPHHSCTVIELSAVVGGREKGNQLLFGKEFIPVLHHLMRTADQVQLVLAQEVRNHLFPEHIAHPPLRLSPQPGRWLRVCPQQVAEEASIGNFSWP